MKTSFKKGDLVYLKLRGKGSTKKVLGIIISTIGEPLYVARVYVPSSKKNPQRIPFRFLKHAEKRQP